MKRNRELALGLIFGLCIALLVTSYILVTFIMETWVVVEQVELQMIGKEAFVTATINSDIVGAVFLVGFVLATVFIFGCYAIVDWLYPVKKVVKYQTENSGWKPLPKLR